MDYRFKDYRNDRFISIAVALVCFMVIPPLVNLYFLHIMNLMVIYVLVAIGLNILVGYAGQFALTSVAFMAIGAYTTGLLVVRLDWSFWLALPIAGLLTMAIGVVVAFPALRLRGLYLAIVSIAFMLLVHWILIHWRSVTFGAVGFKVPRLDFFRLGVPDHLGIYYISLIVTALLVWIATNVLRSQVGRAFVAIRDSEYAAQSSGISLTLYKTIAFMMSAFYTAIAGGLYAMAVGWLEPGGFHFLQAIMHFAMIVIGGLGSITGSIIGAILITFIPELLRSARQFEEIAFGLLLLVFLVFIPEGLYGLIWRRKRRWREPLLCR